jgi:carboxyl-terminal processing protease
MNKLAKFGMPLVIALSVTLGMIVQLKIDHKKSNSGGINASGSKIDAVLKYINKEYVDTVDIGRIEEKTISKMLEELDPHSVYISSEEYAAMNEPLEGNFDGIGVQFNIQKDTVYVVKTIAGGPSEKVGIHDGDRIVTVNDSVIANKKITNDKVMKLLRGPKGTNVKVGVKRNGEKELIAFNITRDAIPLYSIDVSYMVNKKTGYIKLSKYAKTTYKEFQEAIAKLNSQGMQNLVLDLRGNGGGYMDAAINLVDEFLTNGSLIVYTQGKNRPRQSYYASARESCTKINLVVLIDEFSASASEITAGAIQDNDRGLIVGRRSFGKGLVQEPVNFNDGSSLRLTIARYYTPSGRCIQKPYQKGDEKDYYADLENRFENGEFTEKDSIKITDTTKYYTINHRVVYGGGGIMPDVFVPADTTGSSDYFARISRKGLEYQFCFDYTDQNRAKLVKYRTAAEIQKYLETQNIINQFINYAEKQGIKPDKKGIDLSGKIIDVQIKALIARNILDNDGFYPIIQSIDKTLIEGIRLVEEKK